MTPPLMLQGEYDMNQTVIDDFPKLIPRIQAEHINATDGVVDVFSQFGGRRLAERLSSRRLRPELIGGACAYYCDEQSCTSATPTTLGTRTSRRLC